ncbi:MAG: hypothetical protein NUV77_10835, partial [Thermoguttaceae bacterium]|nr:hypothetical protein [Thermoguttaceae bacterium]
MQYSRLMEDVPYLVSTLPQSLETVQETPTMVDERIGDGKRPGAWAQHRRRAAVEKPPPGVHLVADCDLGM